MAENVEKTESELDDETGEGIEEIAFDEVSIAALADGHLASLWKDHSKLWGLVCDDGKVMAMVCNAWARRLTEWYGVDRIGFLDCRRIGSEEDWKSRGGPEGIAASISEKYTLVFLLYLDAVHEWHTIPLMKRMFNVLLNKCTVVGSCTPAFESELESWIRESGKESWAIVTLSGHSHQVSLGSKKWEEQAIVDARVRAQSHAPGPVGEDGASGETVAFATDEEISTAIARIAESATSQEEFLLTFNAVIDEIPTGDARDLSREMEESIGIFRTLMEEGKQKEAFVLACSLMELE
jgi:hypothetical protein